MYKLFDLPGNLTVFPINNILLIPAKAVICFPEMFRMNERMNDAWVALTQEKNDWKTDKEREKESSTFDLSST